MIRSADNRQVQEGIQLLTGKWDMGNGWAHLIFILLHLSIEIYMDSPERRRECLYYLAIGHYKIGNLSDAKKFNTELLRHEPRNEQALDLERRIDEKVSKGKVFTYHHGHCISSNPTFVIQRAQLVWPL